MKSFYSKTTDPIILNHYKSEFIVFDNYNGHNKDK